MCLVLEKALVSIRSPNHKPKPTELSGALRVWGLALGFRGQCFSTLLQAQEACCRTYAASADLIRLTCSWPYQLGSPGQSQWTLLVWLSEETDGILKAFDTLVNKRLVQTLMGKEVPE